MSQVTLKLPHVCQPLHVHASNIAGGGGGGGTFRTLVQLLSGLHMSANSQLHHKVQSGLVIIELVKLHYVRVTDPVCCVCMCMCMCVCVCVRECVFVCVVCTCVWYVHVCGVCVHMKTISLCTCMLFNHVQLMPTI